MPPRDVLSAGQPRVVAGAALAGCVLSVASQAVDLGSPVRLAAALLFFALAPGASLLSVLTLRRSRLELGLVVALSLAIVVAIAEAMLAARAWWPGIATNVLAVACAPVLAAQLVAPADRSAAPLRLRARTRISKFLRDRLAGIRTTFACLALLGSGLALWAGSIKHIDVARISGYGLLPALPATYYEALVFVAAGFIFAVSRPIPSNLLLGAGVGALVFVLHGTTPLVYDEPRYPWVYKHLGVIDFIRVHGTVHRATDIYNNWPGFFAANAWFVERTGIPAISYAAWAQVFFELCNAAALLFAVRGLTLDKRVQWCTVWIFLIGNWIGQDYLAPQAFGFLLALVILGLCLRYAPEHPAYQNRFQRFLDSYAARIAGPRRLPGAGLPRDVDRAPLSPSVALVVGSLCSVAILVSHQLSPVMLVVGLAVFVVLTRRLSVSVVIAFALLESGWIYLAWPYLRQHFSLVHFDLFPHPRPAGSSAAHALRGYSVVTDVSRAVIVAIVLLAVAGFVRERRGGRLQPIAAVWAVAPLLMVVVQSYGGEIFLRAYLFALPWLAFLAAAACVPNVTSRTVVPGSWRLAGATLVVGAGFLFAYFGLEKVNYVSSDDVAATQWYERHAPPGSVLAYVAANVPDGLTASYPRFRVYGTGYIPQLVDVHKFRTEGVTKANLGSLVTLLRGADAAHIYLVVSPSEENFVELYGLLPPGSVQGLVPLLRSSPHFRQVFRHGQGYIFELVRPARAANA